LIRPTSIRHELATATVSERAIRMAAQRKKEKDPNDTKDGARAAKKKACHLHKLFKLLSPWNFLLLLFAFISFFAFLRPSSCLPTSQLSWLGY
jgi:hypothetical protein